MWSCNRLPRRLGASPVHRYRRVWQRRVRRRGGRGEQAMAFLISHFARLVRLYCLYIKPRIPLHTRGQRCESLFIPDLCFLRVHTHGTSQARAALYTLANTHGPSMFDVRVPMAPSGPEMSAHTACTPNCVTGRRHGRILVAQTAVWCEPMSWVSSRTDSCLPWVSSTGVDSSLRIRSSSSCGVYRNGRAGLEWEHL